MKTYSLQELKPVYHPKSCRSLSSNISITECRAETLMEAIFILSARSPIPLNEMGYAKKDDISYCVCEEYDYHN